MDLFVGPEKCFIYPEQFAEAFQIFFLESLYLSGRWLTCSIIQAKAIKNTIKIVLTLRTKMLLSWNWEQWLMWQVNLIDRLYLFILWLSTETNGQVGQCRKKSWNSDYSKLFLTLIKKMLQLQPIFLLSDEHISNRKGIEAIFEKTFIQKRKTKSH